MKKTIVGRNLTGKDLQSFEDFYDEISSNWQLKAERMIARRDARLKREMI